MKIRYGQLELDCADAWSHKDFTGSKVSPPSGIIIYATCFSQEVPDSEIFPKDLKAEFYECNLDNVSIPAGCTVTGGTQKRFKVQNDGNDWLIDAQDKPVKPVDYKYFEKFNLPMPDPKDLPKVKVETVDLRAK